MAHEDSVDIQLTKKQYEFINTSSTEVLFGG